MRLFRINGLGGNCSHVVDKYTSYTYPFLPVRVRWHYFRLMFAFAAMRPATVDGRAPLTLARKAGLHHAIAGAIRVFNEPFFPAA
jgi:hypothetical protein